MGTTRILYPRLGALSPDRPAPAPKAPKASKDHDVASFGAVFVNDIGREAMFSMTAPKFPIGSMIVREKLGIPPPFTATAQPSPASTGPGAITALSTLQLRRVEDLGPPLIMVVMLKRERGFNPKANDWEFLTVTGDGKKIEQRQKQGACLNCHQAQAKDDFVFRENVPK